MKKNRFLFFLILFLAFLATVLLIWRLFFFTPGQEVSVPQSTPTPQVKEVPQGQGDSLEDIGRSLKEKFPLYQKVPYKTEEFLLDYSGPLHLQAKLKPGINQKEAEEAVKSFLWTEGINPATHQIDYLIPEP